MGIFADILNPNKQTSDIKKNIQETLNSVKPAVTKIPVENTTTTKRIISDIPKAGSTLIPEKTVIPKKGEQISQASGNITTKIPFKVKAEEGKKIAERLMNNQYDDSTVAGIVQNTIKGIPRESVNVLVDILQATSRAVGSVGITAGNAFTNAMGIGPVFEDEIDTKQTEFSKILFGGKPVKTVQKSVSDVAEQYVKPVLAKAGFGEDTAVGKSSLIQKGLAIPLVAGGIALDLSGFGGKAGVKSFVEGEVPEAFLKFVAKEKSPQILEDTYKKIGLDEINAKNLAFETAPVNTVDDVKNVLINYGKKPESTGSEFANLLKEGQQSVDNVSKETIFYKPKNVSKGVDIYGSVTGDTAKLSSIEIKPSQQKQGFGTKEVANFENWAKENGATKVEIDGYKDSIGFWEKQGYKFEDNFPVIGGIKQDFKYGYKDLIQKPADINKTIKNVDNTPALYNEARKYNTADEFVNVMKTKHRPPEADGGMPLNSLNDMFPDIYSDKAKRYYASYGMSGEDEALKIIKQLKDKPDSEITIYRAINKDETPTINGGDWVTISKDYAKSHGESNLDKGFKIISKKVKASDIFNDGNSILEFGYRPNGHRDLTRDELKQVWNDANKPTNLKIQSVQKPYKETGNLTTKILRDLEGKTTVSRQYIVDSTKRQGISGSEVKIINDVLAKTKGDVIDVAKFAEKVKKELIPLNRTSSISEADSQTMSEDEAIQAIKDGKKVWGVETDYDDNITLSPTPLRLKDILNEDGDSYEYYTTNKGIEKEFIAKYEFVSLPKDVKGNVVSYKENVYEGKIRTDGSESHFPEQDKYMLHTRVENMADGKTRRVIEVQSDLYQKGNLENVINLNAKSIYDKKGNARDLGGIKLIGKEVEYKNEKYRVVRSSTYGANVDIQNIKTGSTLMKIPVDYFIKSEFNTLNQYKNPTIHFRGVREEIKKAVDDGIEKLQFPTGETAMKIEGLGQHHDFVIASKINAGLAERTLTPEKLKIGEEVINRQMGSDKWIITDVLENGKFRATTRSELLRMMNDFENAGIEVKNYSNSEFVEVIRKSNNENHKKLLDKISEQFDISGKVDTSNPIYKFYENDLAKYLKNNYDAKLVTDNKGVTWNEVTIKPEMGGPVTAFKRTQGNLNYSIKIKSSDVKKIIGENLKGIMDPEKINWVFDKKLTKQGVLGRFSWDPRMEYLNPRLKPMIELYERWGKVSAGTAFHESYHYIETKIFSKEFVRKLDKMTLQHITKEDIRYYRKQGYGPLREILAEYRADAFATERLAKGGFKKGKMQQVLELMDRALRNLVLNIKKFVNYYRNLPNKQGGFAKNPFAKKIKEELPEDLQRMKDMIEIKEQTLAMNPMRKLAKYESKAYPGELPEVTGEKGKGKYNQRGDQMWAELVSESFTGENLPDQADINKMYQSYVKQRQELVDYKREYQKARVEYYANKKDEVSKKAMVEKDEKALERILNQQARDTENLIYKTERADILREQLKETQKRLASEQAYKDLYKSKVKEARTVSFKTDSYYQIIKNSIKRSLKPIKLLDPKSKEIYKDWKTKLIIGKELANAEASAFKNIPAKEGMDIINAYEAGKDTEYTKDIKMTFDSLRKEARERGLDIGFKDNYIPHVYKENAIEIKNAIANYMVDKGVEKYIIDDYMSGIHELSPELASKLKLNPSFTKERTLPTYKIAREYGLTPKYENPAQLVAYYRQEMEKTLANRDFMKKLEEEVKILPSSIAPKGWKEIELPYGKDRWFAKPDLAQIINSEIGNRDISQFSISDRFWYAGAKTSKKMQEIALSAGVPKSNINFFSTGILIKEITSGNIKSISPYLRSNSNTRSIKYFQDNISTIKDMSKQGIDISSRVGNYTDVYNTLSSKWKNKEYTSLLGDSFDKLFNEKTFGSFMPQLTIQTFKDAQKKALKIGMSKEDADRFAGNVARNIMGIIEDVGRSKATEDKISTIFFAPKFRESIINVFMNTIKSGSTEFRNPEFYRNRRLIAGLIISYAIYNYINYKLNGNYMWDNENGREFALKIPTGNKNKDIVYLEFMPSQLSFMRNMASGFINLLKGDLKTSAQKFGGVFSMPIKLATDVMTNSDYFGREIYKDSDTRSQKAWKISKYIGLALNHPYIKEIVNQISDESKPVYQSVSIALEFPFKFSTEDKVAQNKFYEAQDKARIEQIRARDAFMPTYEKIKKLNSEGKTNEVQNVIDGLSDEEYEILKNISTTEKRAKTIKDKTEFTGKYNEIIVLKEKGEVEKVQNMIDNMTDDEYKAFTALAKEFKGKTTKQVKAEKTIIGLVVDYAKAYAIDPSNAFKAMFTSEVLGEVEGNLVELRRFKGVDFNEEGGSEQYVKQLLDKAGIPISERSKYNLEHITPVKAGGSTDPDNLYLVERSIHNSYTPVDILASSLVKKGKITKGQVTKIMNRLKVERVITPDEAINEFNNLVK